ncbi:PAS domain-containing sensor histidine kinase [Mucilaginibacter agri]|uniref:Oxygen sensor histidine kinase NreB n=1 Tax=Mucilaginibacter agri TaxID=2695265 RepID=A0A965ZME5_9SPHI|nr:ATP-binding protein [Mucilaginibacter agri]NCD72272.1 PAS domain-containing protein [Mucilaginibacter agri]
MKNKKFLQHDKAILDKLHADAEKILSKSISDDMDTDQADMRTLLSQLKINLLKLEFQNQELSTINTALEEQQANFTRIYDLAPVGYVILNEAGIIQDINNAGFNLLEASRSSIIRSDFGSYIAPDFFTSYSLFFKQILQTRARQSCKLKIVSKANREFYAQLDGIAIYTATNALLRCYIAIVDITDVKNAANENTALKLEHQKNIALASVAAQENERKRISTALHDGIGQLLYGIKMQIDILNTEHPSPAVEKIYQLLETAVIETRNIAFELAPSILTDFGLFETITELTQRLSTPKLQIKTRISGFTQRMDIYLELCIFRIVQELINNSIKHADASVVELSLTQAQNIEIIVHDNGKGFKPQPATTSAGTGISSIKNRISLYSGTLEIQSELKKGTTATITLQY